MNDTKMTTRIFEPQEYVEAAGLLTRGETVVFPTETVYGLGADAGNAEAVEKIFLAKGRPSDNPLIIHFSSPEELREEAVGLNGLGEVLLSAFCPGPFTLVAGRGARISPRACAGLPTAGLRVPESEAARLFLAAAGVPVAAPSANRSGRPSPSDFSMACEEMLGRVAGILKGPPATQGIESTIVFPESDSRLHVLRAGSVGLEDLARAGVGFSPKLVLSYRSKEYRASDLIGFSGREIGAENFPGRGTGGTELPAAPGTRYRHYSPGARVRLFRTVDELEALVLALSRNGGGESRAAFIFPKGVLGGREQLLLQELHLGESSALEAEDWPKPAIPEEGMFKKREGLRGFRGGLYLWEAADLQDYARGLYHSFSEADRLGCPDILAFLPESVGLGLALADRLQRAAGLVG